MPMKFTTTTGGDAYGNPFVGPIDHTVGIDVDCTALTSDEIDAKGYVKPGVPLTKAGALVGAAAFVYGVTVEATKVADGNAAGDIAGAGTVALTVALISAVNKDVIEDILGRALTANELAGFDLAGSKTVLIG